MGAFILPGDWLSKSGSISSMIGITIGALLMILIAVSYGALVEHFPVSGGAFAFSFLGFGRYISFFSSWFLTFGYICVVALNATAFSLLVKFLIPGVLKIGKLYTIAGWDVYITEILIASVSLIAFMFITIKGASVSGSLQYYFCIAIIITILLLLLIPGSPASLSMPSYIALGMWAIIGLIFFVVRYPKLKYIDGDYLSRMILNHSEEEINTMINDKK